jgi:alkyldihydroxyacetonephosphate synthase
MELRGFMTEMVCSELEDIVGTDNVSRRESDKLAYGVDYFWIGRMWADKGRSLPAPDFIVRPGSATEVARLLQVANYYKMPVVTWGGGSGSQGGALPMSGGMILDTKRMNRVLDYDDISMKVTVETGINSQQLEWYANERGHSLMHYPSSLTCATIGGFLAHRGIGVLSNKYGKIDDMCLNLQVALPDGTLIDSLPVPKHAAGPDLKEIFIGSEGTLGVITKATFKLYEQPEVRKFRAFIFKDLGSGIAAGKEIMRKIRPSIVRLYDEAETVSIIKKVIGVERRGAFMNLAVEGMREMVELEERIMLGICAAHGGEDLGSEWGEKWWENRITFFYPGHIMEIPQMFGTMDSIAAYADVEKVYWAMKRAVEDGFPGVRFIAHFSHWYEWGCMVYDRFIMEKPPEDPEEAIRLHNRIWNAGIRAALANGGVINDHHGIGLKLSRLMKEQYGPAMKVFEGIKKTVDPNGIMNPWKLGL